MKVTSKQNFEMKKKPPRKLIRKYKVIITVPAQGKNIQTHKVFNNDTVLMLLKCRLSDLI